LASSDKTNEFAAPGKGVLPKYQITTALRKMIPIATGTCEMRQVESTVVSQRLIHGLRGAVMFALKSAKSTLDSYRETYARSASVT